MFPQGWHWPRLSTTGSSTAETTVYVATRDLVGYQLDDVTWAAGYFNGHPELVMRVVDTCPAGRNCIRTQTQDLTYPTIGLTSVSFNSSRHLLSSTLRLDPVVNSRAPVFHEMCHGLGGGFTPPGEASIHEFCNWEWRSLIFDEISRVYHDDPG